MAHPFSSAVGCDIGGGFGQKTGLYPEDGIVAYAVPKLAKKIRWRGDRTARSTWCRVRPRHRLRQRRLALAVRRRHRGRGVGQ
jgi:CO/xanthine dehydrogenase Mo-binding subunit